jgi:hypothetical protein
VVEEDKDGKAVVNSANDYFDPPITKDQSRPVLTLTRNEQTFNPDLAAQFKDHTNSGGFFGWDVGQVKCSNIVPNEEYHPEIGVYYSVSYEFQFEPKGWKRKVLDQGLRKLTSGKQDNILIKGLPVQSPALLDGHGQPNDPAADPVFLEFTVYDEVDFGSLNLE